MQNKKQKPQSIAKKLLAGLCLAPVVLFLSTKSFAQNNSFDDQVIANIEATKPDDFMKLPSLSIEDKAKLTEATRTSLRIDKYRDIYRHPAETLEFFGIKPNDKVIEIWPGQGWYSTVLGSYLKTGNGELIAAHFDTSTTNSQLVKDLVDNYKNKFIARPDDFGRMGMVSFGPKSGALGAPNSADAVLTFRNIHNWMNQGWADKAFDDFFKVLKPGGILGIEEHRASEDGPQDPLAADGYMREDYVIDMAKEAGFIFIGKSEINANPKDTKDHPFGVWTLPPVGRTAPAGQPANPKFDQTRYKAIGESDRMTLLFKKPLNAVTPVLAKGDNNKKDDFKPVKMIFGKPKATENKNPPPVKAATIIEPVKPPPVEPAKKEVTKLEPIKNAPIAIDKNQSIAEKPIAPPVDKKPEIEIVKPVVEKPVIDLTPAPKTEVETANKSEVPDFKVPDFKTPEANANPVPVKLGEAPKEIEKPIKAEVEKKSPPPPPVKAIVKKPAIKEKPDFVKPKIAPANQTKPKVAEKPAPKPEVKKSATKKVEAKKPEVKKSEVKKTATKPITKPLAKTKVTPPPVKKNPNIPDWGPPPKKK